MLNWYTTNPGNVFGFYFGHSHVTQTCFFHSIFLFHSIHSLSMTAACSFYSTFLKSHPHPVCFIFIYSLFWWSVHPLVGRLGWLDVIYLRVSSTIPNHRFKIYYSIRAFVRSSNEFRFVQCFLFYLQLSHAVNKFLFFVFSSFHLLFFHSFDFFRSLALSFSPSISLATRASIVLLTYLHKAILFLYPISTISECVS